MAENRYLQPMTDWPPIILTAIGSGAVGSIITTYGTQTRERRQARAQAREAIRQVQNSAYPVPTQEQLTATLDNLETSAMLAGLPKNLIAINREAIYIRRGVMESVATASPPDDPSLAASNSDLAFAADHIAGETLQLLVDATWHPILSAPYRWWRTRHLARVMDTRPRPGPRQRDKRRWERQHIRKAKRELKQRRRALRAKRWPSSPTSSLSGRLALGADLLVPRSEAVQTARD